MRSVQIKSILFFLMLLVPAITFAGEIFGTIKKDGKPLAQQEVRIVQNGQVIGTTKTDANGYYSITIKQVGKVTLELPGFEGATFDVFSTNNSSDYTLSVVKAGDKWQLKKQ